MGAVWSCPTGMVNHTSAHTLAYLRQREALRVLQRGCKLQRKVTAGHRVKMRYTQIMTTAELLEMLRAAELTALVAGLRAKKVVRVCR